MALVAAFTATESLANPDEITFTDTSTGTDLTITTRRIYFQLANGNWVDENGDESTTETYIEWDYADSSIVLSLITQSTASDIEVKWMAGSTETYSVSEEYGFNLYDYLAGLQLLQGNTSAPEQVQDTNYYSNMCQFIVNIWNEEAAIEYGGDIFSSQGAMNRNQLMILNDDYYF